MRRRLLLLCVGMAMAVPAGAQIVGRPFEFSAQAGVNHYDMRSYLKAGPGYAGSIGWRAYPWMVLEGQVWFGPSEADTAPHPDRNLFSAGLDLRMNMRPAESRVVPFLLGGYGYMSSHGATDNPPDIARGSASIGLGMLYNLMGNSRTYIRFQARDFMFRENGALEFSNHFAVTLGLHYLWGGKVQDTDRDGVREWLDSCAATPIGAKVNAQGCPLDSDGDKVLDGLDSCAATPLGCTVDKNGCPSDADGDGVCDGLDTCPNTPKGSSVDAHGCPADPDSDGVMSGIDQCPDTPRGCTVDEKGCPSDADKDGICDGVDLCPNTPEGVQVDAFGCPIEVSEKEIELLDTGMIRLQNVNFDTGKATITPESFPVLADVARILQQYPTLQIEIGGHTDNKGKAATNDKLSADRAAAVLDYIKQNFPQVTSSQFSSKGYGSSKPIAPNTTQLGRAKNRRVEFKVLNNSALRTEREKRSFLKKGGGTVPKQVPLPEPIPAVPAPPDTTKK